MSSLLELRGDNYKVGFELGQWWVERMSGLNECDYKCELESKGFKTKYFPLLDYAYKNFPELMAEIKGMADGITEAGWKTSIENVFLYSLGENWGCSSFVMKKKDSILMGHNEEDDKKYPLCVAKVSLECDKKKPIEFVSVSYPFQLFGSVGGMNRHLAFQGNSIGVKGKSRELKNTWRHRAPKTFLTRKMLECTNIGDIEELFLNHHSTLPSHHFIVMSNEAYSLEIRPVLDKNPSLYRLKTTEISSDFSAHTNHFINKDGEVDWEWIWKNKSDIKDSEDRLEILNKIANRLINLDSNEDILGELKAMKNMGWNDFTSASLSFHMRKNSNDLSIKQYFGRERRTDVSIRH